MASAAGAAIVANIESVFAGIAAATRVPLQTHDDLPLPVSNAPGLVQFYFLIGLVIGGYLLGPSSASAEARRHARCAAACDA